MNLEELRLELEADEGCKYEIYLDHLGLPTCGIGHLIVEGDDEFDCNVGEPVSKQRVAELFEQDIDITLDECERLYRDFSQLPEEAQRVIANMMFNMGRPRLSKFKGMKAGVDARDWNKAADEMVDSKWYQQVTNRAERLVQRIRALA
jgi:lysozyme